MTKQEAQAMRTEKREADKKELEYAALAVFGDDFERIYWRENAFNEKCGNFMAIMKDGGMVLFDITDDPKVALWAANKANAGVEVSIDSAEVFVAAQFGAYSRRAVDPENPTAALCQAITNVLILIGKEMAESCE